MVSDATGRKLEILTAARHLLAVRGYDRTTMADIASEVGLVESGLYRHFSSKRELFHECVRVFYEPILNDLHQAERAIDDPRALLRYVIWRHLRTYVEGPELNRLVVVQARQVEGRIDAAVRQLNREYTSVLRHAVESGIRRGVFRADLDPRLVRDMVYGMIEHMWLRLDSHGEELDVDALTTEILGLVEPALLAPSESDQDVRAEIHRLAELLTASVNDNPATGIHDEGNV